MTRSALRLKPGQQIAPHLTVVGALDDRGPDPVYVAWDHRNWCAVCCKLFRRASQAGWETATLQALAHPGIVRMLEDGAPRYMVMEFLEGPTLRKLIHGRRTKRLAVADALRVAIQVGAALCHLHDRGIVHLDVKPRNIIVTRRRPVLFDLGCAQPLDGKPLGRPRGTDAFMAPEQCRFGVPTTACDVFGLGVTLFEMLTGERPFPVGTDDEPFPQLRVPATPLRRLLPRAPAELERILQACLAADPVDRPGLARLLPILNGLIARGPRMWPPGFDPAPATARAPEVSPQPSAPPLPSRVAA